MPKLGLRAKIQTGCHIIMHYAPKAKLCAKEPITRFLRVLIIA